MKTELINILKEMNEVIKETGLNITDKTLFQEAVKIHLTKEIGNQKKTYKPFFKNDFKKDNTSPNPLLKKDEPATTAQIYTIKQYGKQVPAGLTKREASKIIKGIKNG